jgi:hypothetical protein
MTGAGRSFQASFLNLQRKPEEAKKPSKALIASAVLTPGEVLASVRHKQMPAIRARLLSALKPPWPFGRYSLTGMRTLRPVRDEFCKRK